MPSVTVKVPQKLNDVVMRRLGPPMAEFVAHMAELRTDEAVLAIAQEAIDNGWIGGTIDGVEIAPPVDAEQAIEDGILVLCSLLIAQIAEQCEAPEDMVVATVRTSLQNHRVILDAMLSHKPTVDAVEAYQKGKASS